MNQIVEHKPVKSVTMDMATRFGMEPDAFEQTLRRTVVPEKCTREQFAAFLLVAKKYDLDPLTKEIYAFPTQSGGIQPIVSIDGWVNLINSHPSMDGLEFEDHFDDSGKLTAVSARIWRKDRTKPIVVTEYMEECARNTQPWKQWPRRMLRHKTMIQCARYAFGFAGIIDPDEYDRMSDVGVIHDITSRASLSERLAAAKDGASASNQTGFSHAHVINEIDGAINGGASQSNDEIQDNVNPNAHHDDSSLHHEAAPAPSDPASTTGGAGDNFPGDAAALPDNWQVEYVGVLRRARQQDSLKKFSAKFWDQYGGREKYAKTDDGKEAAAIFMAFEMGFGDRAAIDAQLREIGVL